MQGEDFSDGPPERASALRVLLAEDNALIAQEMQRLLIELGFRVTGPFATLDAALDAAHKGSIDLAIVDVDLQGRKVFPLLERLQARRTPFALVTGRSRTELPVEYQAMPFLQKPFDRAALQAICKQLVQAREAG